MDSVYDWLGGWDMFVWHYGGGGGVSGGDVGDGGVGGVSGGAIAGGGSDVGGGIGDARGPPPRPHANHLPPRPPRPPRPPPQIPPATTLNSLEVFRRGTHLTNTTSCHVAHTNELNAVWYGPVCIAA